MGVELITHEIIDERAKEKGYHTMVSICRQWGIKSTYLQKELMSGRLESYRVNSQHRFKESHLRSYIEKYGIVRLLPQYKR